MLTQRELRIGPWMRTPPSESIAAAPAGWLRWIDSSAANDHLGIVRLVQAQSWFGLGPQCLEICETEDASLLATVQHGWFAFGQWRVFDAEQCCVGGVVGAHVLDGSGARWATIWQEGTACHLVRGRSDRVYARMESMADGGTRYFPANDLDANPFLRMVLLATCVLRAPAPRMR